MAVLLVHGVHLGERRGELVGEIGVSGAALTQ